MIPPFWDAAVLSDLFGIVDAVLCLRVAEKKEKAYVILMVLTDCCTNLETPPVPAAISEQQAIQASVM